MFYDASLDQSKQLGPVEVYHTSVSQFVLNMWGSPVLLKTVVHDTCKLPFIKKTV